MKRLLLGTASLFVLGLAAPAVASDLPVGNTNNSFSSPAGAAVVPNRISQNVDMVTVRVNYRFGGPVIPRY